MQAAEEDEVLECRDPQVEGAVAGGHKPEELARGLWELAVQLHAPLVRRHQPAENPQ